jgi:DNA-binding MarR family transcriptional regulator
MVDNSDWSGLPAQNIRGLLLDLASAIDERFDRSRRGTRYANVRPSDVRIFVFAGRGGQTVPDIARTFRITRQAVYASIKRLEKLGVVALEPMPGNQRDMIVAVTQRGGHALATAAEQVQQLERDFAGIVGRDGLESLRQALGALLLATRAKNAEEAKAGQAPAAGEAKSPTASIP